MDSATSSTYDVNRLTSPLVKVWPYSRGYFPRDTLYILWRALEEDGSAKLLFHSQQCPPDMPYSWKGDLTQFIQWFESPGRLLLICESQKEQELAGLIWFDEIISKYRATASIFFRKKYRGKIALEASKMAADYGFNALGLQSIWAYTPWKNAARHAQTIGFKPKALLPGLNLIDGKPHDVFVLKLDKEDFKWGETKEAVAVDRKPSPQNKPASPVSS